MRFFSPPEKPTFTGRFRISSAMPSSPARLRNQVVSSFCPRFLRTALKAVRRNVSVATPGIYRVLEGEKHTLAARRRPMASRSSLFQSTSPSTTS